jgi:hypothetical protein
VAHRGLSLAHSTALAARWVIDAAIANGITLTVELELSADELRTLSAEAH